MRRYSLAACVVALLQFCWCGGLAAQEGSSEAFLASKGLSRSGGYYLLDVDIQLPDRLKVMRATKTKADETTRKRAALDREIKSIDSGLIQINRDYADLESRLRKIKNGPTRDQLIRSFNDAGGKLRDAEAVRKAKINEREKIPDLSEEYASMALELADRAETAARRYPAFAADPGVTAALADINRRIVPTAQLGPTPEFLRQLPVLRKERQALGSGAIKCDVRSGLAQVTVTLNGTLQQVMLVDSGASTVLLPWDVATRIGITPGPNDRSFKGTAADGKAVELKQMVLKSVKLGRFTAENVECAVLPRNAKNAGCLLGSTFLERFSYRMDLAAGLLYLSEKDTEVVATAAPAVAANSKAPDRGAMQRFGLVKVASTYVLEAEIKISEGLRIMRQAKVRMDETARRRAALEREIKTIDESIEKLSRQVTELSAGMKTGKKASKNDYGPYNDALLKLREAENKKQSKQQEMQKLPDGRGDYAVALADVAEKMEIAAKRYPELAADLDVMKAIAELNRGAEPNAKLGPSAEFVQQLPLVRAARLATNGTLIKFAPSAGLVQVAVTLNGIVSEAMLVDSGASFVTLSHETAVHAGLSPGPKDPIVKLTIANGKSVDARRMFLKSVKLGPYTVENVECVVSPKSLHDAPNLLGGTFLRYFDYRVDLAAGEMRLSPWSNRDVKTAPGTVPERREAAGPAPKGTTPPAGAPSSAAPSPSLQSTPQSTSDADPAPPAEPPASAGSIGSPPAVASDDAKPATSSAPDASTTGWTELLLPGKSAYTVHYGVWKRDGTDIVTNPRSPYELGRIAFPVTCTGSYDLQVTFQRTEEPKTKGNTSVVIPVGPSLAQVVLGWKHGSLVGLGTIDGQKVEANPAYILREGLVPADKPNVADIHVALDQDQADITIRMNGEAVVHWKGPVKSLSYEDFVAPQPIFLHYWGVSLRFTSMKLRIITGELQQVSAKRRKKPTAPGASSEGTPPAAATRPEPPAAIKEPPAPDRPPVFVPKGPVVPPRLFDDP